MKNKLSFVFILSFLLLLNMKPFAQGVAIEEWRDHLPYDYATNVEEFGDFIFASTPYSLFYYDNEYSSVHRLSKVNGLSDLGVSDISANRDRQVLVVAYTNTNLDLIRDDMSIVNIPDIKRKEILGNKTINSVMNYDKYAYLSCGFGIVVVNLAKEEIKDTYYIGPDGGYINVLAMAHNDTAFFAATEKGVYYAAIDDPNLAYFGNWHKMTGLPYPNGYYNLVYVFNDMLIINHHDEDDTEDDLYVFRDGAWSDLDSQPTELTYSIRSTGDELVISYKGYVKTYDAALNETLKIYTYGSSNVASVDAIIGTDNFFWIADRSKGLVKAWGGGYENEFIKPSGAPTADIFDMDVRGGHLWLVPGGIDGTWGNTWRTARIFSLIDESWTTYDPWNTPQLLPLRDMVSVTVDPLDPSRVYAGSWSAGLVEMTDGVCTNVYGLDNSSLEAHMLEGAPVCKVGKTAFDSQHNLWVVNSGAENIVSVMRQDGSGWQSYNLGPSSQGNDVMKLIVDTYDQKWLVLRTTQSNSNFLYVFDENGDPGKQFRALKSGAGLGNLPGTSVYAIAEDQEGEIWVGTDEGIAIFYDAGSVLTGGADAERPLVDFDGYVQYLLETEAVKAIAVDGANRKWIGTERAGVFLLSADGQKQLYHFTEDDSPLLSNSITCITISDSTGEVFFGTPKGLISYRSTAIEPGPANNEAYAYPNPVKPGYTGVIAVKGLKQVGETIKVTDISGRVIYEDRSSPIEYYDEGVLGAQFVWRYEDWQKAASGVYLVFIANSDGSDKLVTKVMILK